MSEMQLFYQQLSQASEGQDAYLQSLAKLTGSDRDRIAALASDLEWISWTTAEQTAA